MLFKNAPDTGLDHNAFGRMFVICAIVNTLIAALLIL